MLKCAHESVKTHKWNYFPHFSDIYLLATTIERARRYFSFSSPGMYIDIFLSTLITSKVSMLFSDTRVPPVSSRSRREPGERREDTDRLRVKCPCSFFSPRAAHSRPSVRPSRSRVMVTTCGRVRAHALHREASRIRTRKTRTT